MARIPKTRDQRIAEGNPSGRALPPPDPATRKDIVSSIDASSPPKTLNAYGKKYFKTMIKLGNWLKPADLLLITEACLIAEKINDIENDLNEWRKSNRGMKGLESAEMIAVVKPNSTDYIINPLSRQRAKYADILFRYLQALSFTPINRLRLSNETAFANENDKTKDYFD